MKKMIFGAAAAFLCGSVFAIESANIVGYQTKEVRENLSVQLPTFDGVASTGIDIQSIKPVLPEGATLESGDFTIQIYGDRGAIQTQYQWVLGEDIDEGYADGWYEEDWETLVDKSFDVGEAFNVWSIKGGSLQYAGQVLTAQTAVPVRLNLSCQGNFRPVAVDIQSIIPAVPDEESLESGDFTIQIYGDRGAIQTQYQWVLGEDIDEGYADGWYEEDWETLVDKSFEAGEGFNVWAIKGGTLTFPALSL